MYRPILIDFDPFELKFYPFMVSLDKCSGFKVSFFQKYNVNIINMITNKNEAKNNDRTYFM